ncbi:NAD(P)-dependent oxidoreductase, partial [candidate division WOR-3 bacterium]|nr:NAD(P)-dependent oxidoreductase [candidate division WOR-3 bacterium]
MRVVIIGAEGQLGSDLVRAFQGEDIVPLSENDVDIVNINKLKEIISSESPDLVINTAAFSNVPQCEREPEKALRVNAIGARNVAIVTGEIKSLHLYISTDYVFDGEKGKPYLEDDSTAPVNTYGLSKLAGEYYVRYILDRYFIVRTSGLYGIHRCISKGTNFVDKMLELRDRDSI